MDVGRSSLRNALAPAAPSAERMTNSFHVRSAESSFSWVVAVKANKLFIEASACRVLVARSRLRIWSTLKSGKICARVIWGPPASFTIYSGTLPKVVINVPRSKADQEQAGDKVAIPFGEHNDTCPIKALRQWLKVANIIEGALFRGVDRHGHVATTGLHRDSIAVILKTAAARAGMNATNIAGHGVRAGMAIQAALNGSSERAIAKTTRHRSRRVLRRYIRPGEMFRENASASLGL